MKQILPAIIVLAIALAISVRHTEANCSSFTLSSSANATLCQASSNSTYGIYKICCKPGFSLVGGPDQYICENGNYTQIAGQCTFLNATSTQAPSPTAAITTPKAAAVVSATLSQTLVAWCFTMLLIAMRLI